MKRLAFLTLMALALAPSTFAQDQTTTTRTTTTRTNSSDSHDYNHGEFGAFFDYLRLDNAGTNNFGLGGRAGFNIHPHVQLEGEIAYDFRESRTATIVSAFSTTTYKADFRVLHGLFGPKFHTNGPVRFFGLVKGGFINFGVTTAGAPAGFTNSFGNVVDGDTHFTFYPGAGVEAFAGWFGIRGEVGDEIYWQNGANHNFKMSIGPVIRF